MFYKYRTFRMNLMPKNAVNYYCEKCDFKCSKQSNWNKHVNTRKHRNRTLLNDIEQKTAKNAVTFMNANVEKYTRREIVYGIIEKNAPFSKKTMII